ncbi:unnamed protein product [Closterium sp. Naga37s-1]|nr:unnamed protein product [Closterium sp. Naga37s-1]
MNENPFSRLALHFQRLDFRRVSSAFTKTALASFQKSLHLPVSSRAFPCVRAVSVEGETAVEEAVEAVPESTDAAAEQTPAPAAAAEEKTEERKARPGATRRRKVTVNVEDLQPGQELTGKVRSVKPYGAFVDIGAFTDGLVHISQLATGFVNKVEDVVTVGQEVVVRVIEASKESGRIALTMRDLEAERVAAEETAAVDAERKALAQQRRQSAGGAEGDAPERKVAGRGRRQQREDQKPTHNYKKGQKVKGVVKNLTSYGCFVELEGKVEGLLHASEIAPGGDMVPVESLVSVGQELEVTIAKVEKNRISLTMKEEVDVTLFNETSPQDEEIRALNPFEAAFRRANLVTDAPRRAPAAADAEEELLVVEKKETTEAAVETVAEAVEEAAEEAAEAVAAAVEEEKEEKVEEEAAPVPLEAVAAAEPAAAEAVAEVAEAVVVADITAVEEKKEEAAPAPAATPAAAAGGISAAVVKQLREETGAGMMACKKALTDANGDLDTAREILRKKGLASADKKASRVASEGLVSSYVHSDRIGVLIEVNCETDFVARGSAFQELVEDLGMQVAACPQVEVVSVEDVPAEQVAKEREVELGKEDLASKPEAVRGKIVDGRMAKRLNELALLEQPYIKNDKVMVKDVVKQAIASLGENIRIRRFVRFNLGEGIEKKSADFAAEVAAASQVQAPAAPAAPAPAAPAAEAAPEPAADKPKVAVSMAAVKQLRDATGAGMMDCKKALESTDGDVDAARELLRKKGLASADKKASRVAAEGIVGSYIHDGRIGALIEINCETDFVARGDKFRELVDDLAMQVVACPGVQVVSEEDVDSAWLAKEREIEMGKEDLASKPEAVRGKIVDGRLAKRVSELALLEQPFIKNDKVTVKEVVKEVVAALGENIRVRRFERFTLGEGIEKKVSDFAAEVAAAAGQA